MAIDFDTLERLSTIAREEYGLAGCVQHGASTLPEEAFGHFPAAGCAEIHLATGFQNILYDGGGLPADLRAEMMAWCLANCADERKPGETDEQFLYKTRKKALGPFKEALWSIGPEAEAEIGANLAARLGLLFERWASMAPATWWTDGSSPGRCRDRCRRRWAGRRADHPRRRRTVHRRRIGVGRAAHAAQVPRHARRDADDPARRTDIWNLGDFVVGRITFEPGWRWSTDVKPIAGTDWCVTTTWAW